MGRKGLDCLIFTVCVGPTAGVDFAPGGSSFLLITGRNGLTIPGVLTGSLAVIKWCRVVVLV